MTSLWRDGRVTFCVTPSLLDSVLVDAFLADEADVGHVAEVLVEVESVSDHELVRDLEGDVVRCVAIALESSVDTICPKITTPEKNVVNKK